MSSRRVLKWCAVLGASCQNGFMGLMIVHDAILNEKQII